MKNKEVGFVISVSPYKDYDAMVNILTNEGKKAFKARGILKPTSKNAPSCQLFSLGEFVLNESNNRHTLISAYCIKKVKNLIDNPKVATFLSFLAEVISKSEDVNAINYFDFMDSIIDLFNNGFNDILSLTLITLSIVMGYEGISLNASKCSKCGSKENITTVSYENGGFLCLDCSEIAQFDVKYLTYFRYTNLATINDLSRFSVPSEIGQRLLKEYFDYIEDSIGVYYRHKKILEKILF